MQLDPQWRDWHKLWSLRLTGLLLIASNLWVLLPAVQYFVSPVFFLGLSAVAFAGIVLVRVLKQASTDL